MEIMVTPILMYHKHCTLATCVTALAPRAAFAISSSLLLEIAEIKFK